MTFRRSGEKLVSYLLYTALNTNQIVWHFEQYDVCLFCVIMVTLYERYNIVTYKITRNQQKYNIAANAWHKELVLFYKVMSSLWRFGCCYLCIQPPPPLPRHPPYTTDYNQNCPSVNVKGKNCFELLRRNLWII